MKKLTTYILSLTLLAFTACQKTIGDEPLATGTVKVTFKNTVQGNPMVLNTGNYTNSHGEQYTISKFKYYISNLSVTGVPSVPNGLYFLVDESIPASLSLSFDAPVGKYQTLSFTLGVDSTRNVSGAQTGALDPLNDMFWTWNSGYIMAKMEGNSPQSPVVNNKVEYHIGGFTGANNVVLNKGFAFAAAPYSPLDVRANKTSEIFIDADFDTWWQGSYDLKIAITPAATHPGAIAKSISNNYNNMFTITDIKNY